MVEEASPQSFDGMDIVFISAGGDASRQWAHVAIAAGAIVVDNSSVFRMNADVPLVIPEEVKLEKEEYLVFDDGSVDAFKPKDIQKIDSFKPKEMVHIKCPSCGSQMEIPKLNKMQDVECGSCGLAGEIKK